MVPETTLEPGSPDGGRVRRLPLVRSRLRAEVTSRLVGVQAVSLAVFYGAVIIFFALRTAHFLTAGNIDVILASVAVIGIVSLGQSFAVISGGFDLSVAGVLPLGSVCYAIFSNDGMPVAAATVLAVTVGAFCGVVNGTVISLLKINPLITTLATLSVTGGLAYTITSGQTIVLLSPAAGVWGNTSVLGLQGGVILMIILAVIAAGVLRYTVYGRSLYAIGGNREASRLAGLRVTSITMSVYLVTGSCAALAGAVTTGQLLAGSPGVGADTALNSIAAVILGGASLGGGVGGVGGTLLGVLLLGTVSDGMSLIQVPSFYQEIATGGILLAAVVVARIRTLAQSRRKRVES